MPRLNLSKYKNFRNSLTMKNAFVPIIFCFFITSFTTAQNIYTQAENEHEINTWDILESIYQEQETDAIELYQAALAAMMSSQSALAKVFFERLDKIDGAQDKIKGKNFWHALCLVDLGYIDQAQILLSRALEQDSLVHHLAQNLQAGLQNMPPVHQDTQAMLIYARGRSAKADFAQANDVLENIIQDKGNIYIPYALFYQGQNHTKMQRNEEAAGRYRLLSSLYPQTPIALAADFALAQISSSQEQKTLLNRIALSKQPSIERLISRVNLAIEAANNQDEKSLLAFENMSQTQQEKNRLSYIQAVYYSKENQREKAISILEKAQNFPDEIAQQVRYAHSYYLFKNQDFISAKDNLKGYLSFEMQKTDHQREKTWTENDMLYLAALRALNQEKEMQQFLAHLPLEQSPDTYWLAYYYLCKGWAQIQSGQLNQGMADSSMALNIAPDAYMKLQANYNLALAYAKRGEYVRSEEYFAQAQENAQEQEFEVLQQARALSAFRAKQIDKAERLSNAYKNSPSFFWQSLQAAIYTALGRFDRCAQIYDNLAAQSNFAHRRDARYLAALNHYRNGNPAASNMFKAIIEDNQEPDGNKAAYFWLGKSYENQKNWNQAIVNYQLSLSIPGQSNTDPLRKDSTEGEATAAMLSAMLKSNDERLMPMLRQMRNSNPDLLDQTAYALAEEATAAQKYTLALELYHEIQNKDLRLLSLYSQAQNLEAMGEYTPALNTYLTYLKEDSLSSEALLVSRKIADLSDVKTLQNLIFGSQRINLGPATMAPLILSWIEKADKGQKAKVQKVLSELPLQDLDEIERSRVNLVQARFYTKIQDYPQALSSYDTALNLVLSPQQYFQARKERSQIYEKQGDITQAAKEFLLIEQTFRAYPDIAAQALYEAGLLFQRHHMPSQRDVIQKTLKERYPDTPQASRI